MQAETIAFLAAPGSLGAAAPEIVETHASIVFLSGDRAWKLKRAVRYPYLDYSTPDLRRAACEAELAINRRFAPDLYLEVRAVRRAPGGGLALAGEGAAIDWLLAMRRFDPADQLDEVAARGALTPGLLRQLADRIAAVHQAAAPCRDQGGVEGMTRTIATTIATLRDEAGLPARAVADWAVRIQAALRQQAPLLERRRQDGKVRACHGDLHLRNICLWQGRPTPFDAIEFDPALSSIDLLYDLAFLLMDLHGRGMGAAANAVFNRYLDLTGEEAGLPALPLFLSLRAAIRAEVAAAAALQLRDPAGVRASRAEAGTYLTLARRLLAPEAPRLVAIGGLSGSGKSTLAYRLAPALGRVPGARVLRSDVLRKRQAGLLPEERLGEAGYTPEAGAAAYALLAATARQCLAAGQAVVADAVFEAPIDRAAMAQAASGQRFDGFWLAAPPAELMRRVAARQDDASDATPGVVRAQAARQAAPPAGWRLLDATASPEAVARAVLNGDEAPGLCA